jgi:transcriptional regulator
MVKKTVKTSKKSPQDNTAKAFTAALENMEKLAKEQIENSRNPLTAGKKILTEIDAAVRRIESEIGEDSIAMTEAGYSSDGVVGVGVGVF